MKKRIDTQMYDTETAKKIGEYRHGYDNAGYIEELYKKRTGEYFLHGEGGPASPWAQPVEGDQGAYSGGEDIKPLTYEQAQKWFEKANNDDERLATNEVYDSEFGRPKANEPKEQNSIYLSRTAKRKLERIAAEQGKSQSEIIENLILSE